MRRYATALRKGSNRRFRHVTSEPRLRALRGGGEGILIGLWLVEETAKGPKRPHGQRPCDGPISLVMERSAWLHHCAACQSSLLSNAPSLVRPRRYFQNQ